MPQEQALLPYIDKAFGTNVQAPDMSTFQKTFTEDSKMKREEYKSVSQIGSELDAQSYKQIEGKIKGMLEKARQGELTVGSGDWVQQSGDMIAAASQLKEAEKLRKEYQEQFLSKPDQMVFMEQVGDEMIDTGLQGYLKAQENLMGQEYQSPYELVQKQAEMLQRAQMLPVGVQQGLGLLRRDASGVSKQLLGAGTTELRDAKARFGNVVLNIRTTASDDDVKAAVSSLVDQHGQTISAQWSRMGGSKGTGMSRDEFVADTIEGMLQTEADAAEVRRIPTAPKTDSDSTRRLTSLGGGNFQSGDFIYQFVEKKENKRVAGSQALKRGIIENPTFARIKVTSQKSSEPLKDFSGQGGEAVRGKLSGIVYDKGNIILQVNTGRDTEDLPLFGNEGALEYFYGITEQDIKDMVEGGEEKTVSGAGKDAPRVGASATPAVGTIDDLP